MPRINLLPTKAALKTQKVRQELGVVLLIAAVVVAGLYFWNSSVDDERGEAKSRLAKIQDEVKRGEQSKKKMEKFKLDNQVLNDKLKVIDEIQRQKSGLARLLWDLAVIVDRVPQVWLTEIGTTATEQIIFKGGAMNHDDITEFQQNLETQSQYFKNVQLQEAVSTSKAGIRYLQFEIHCVPDLTPG